MYARGMFKGELKPKVANDRNDLIRKSVVLKLENLPGNWTQDPWIEIRDTSQYTTEKPEWASSLSINYIQYSSLYTSSS